MQLEGRDEETMIRWTELYRKYSGKLKAPGTGADIQGEPKPWHKEKIAETRILDAGRPFLRQNLAFAAIGTLASVCHPQIADYTSAARVDHRRAEEIYKADKVHRLAHMERLRSE